MATGKEEWGIEEEEKATHSEERNDKFLAKKKALEARLFAFCYLLVRFRSTDLPTERSSSLEVRGSWSSSLPEEDEELSEGPFSSQIYKSSSSRCRPAHAFGLPLVFALSFYTRRQNLEKEKKH